MKRSDKHDNQFGTIEKSLRIQEVSEPNDFQGAPESRRIEVETYQETILRAKKRGVISTKLI